MTDWPAMSEVHVIAEACLVARRYPVSPRDAVSRASSLEAERRGWIRRSETGDWFPTREGLRVSQIVDQGVPGP